MNYFFLLFAFIIQPSSFLFQKNPLSPFSVIQEDKVFFKAKETKPPIIAKTVDINAYKYCNHIVVYYKSFMHS